MNFKRYTRTDFYDIIVASVELKKLFLSRCKELDVYPNQACMASGITYSLFSKHFLNRTDALSSQYLRQDKIINVFKTIGIDIKITAIIRGIDEQRLDEIRNTEKRWIA